MCNLGERVFVVQGYISSAANVFLGNSVRDILIMKHLSSRLGTSIFALGII